LHNLVVVRTGIVKANWFVHSFITKHAVLLRAQSATSTTSKDDQTEATVSVVVGESPRRKENATVGQLVLHYLASCPAGVLAICVTIDVDLEHNILLTAEEVESGVSEKTIILGEHHWDEVREVLEIFLRIEEQRQAGCKCNCLHQHSQINFPFSS